MHLILSTCTYFEYYLILCSVWLVLLSYCCVCSVLYDFNGRVILNLYCRGQRSMQALSLLYPIYPNNSWCVCNRMVLRNVMDKVNVFVLRSVFYVSTFSLNFLWTSPDHTSYQCVQTGMVSLLILLHIH